jgi:GMP synthase (glutamine-hydrolysing)
VVKGGEREDGQHYISLEVDSLLFAGMQASEQALLTHGDSVDVIGKGFRVISTHNSITTAIEHAEKKIFAVQFHPEVITLFC